MVEMWSVEGNFEGLDKCVSKGARPPPFSVDGTFRCRLVDLVPGRPRGFVDLNHKLIQLVALVPDRPQGYVGLPGFWPSLSRKKAGKLET